MPNLNTTSAASSGSPASGSAWQKRGLVPAFDNLKLHHIARDLERLKAVTDNFDGDRIPMEVKVHAKAKSIDDVKNDVAASFTKGGFWNVDAWRDDGETGQKAIDGFIASSIDGITSMAGEAGDRTDPVQHIADRIEALLVPGSYQDARLLHLDMSGPQISDARTVLVIKGNDGKYTTLSADEVDV